MEDIFKIGVEYIIIYDDMEQKPKKKEGILLRKELPLLEFRTANGKEILNMNKFVRAKEVENANTTTRHVEIRRETCCQDKKFK